MIDKKYLREKILNAFQKEIPCAIVENFSRDPQKENRKKWIKIREKYLGKNPKILFVSTYPSHYTRTESLQALFQETETLFDARFFSGFFKYFQILLFVFQNRRKYDALFLNFRGHEILPFLRFFWGKKPLIFDAFISLFDTICHDRQKIKSDSFFGRVLKKYDAFLCRISTGVLVDTATHQQYFQKEFLAKNIEYLYVDCNHQLFFPKKFQKKNDFFEVLWYGGAQPIHGIETIIRVAKNLESEKFIRFTLIGPIKKEVLPQNVRHFSWIDYQKLPKKIRAADLCLGGHFSQNIKKADRVIAGKTFQFLACGIPTLVKKNAANAELFDFEK